MFLQNMSPPHALRIHARITPSTKRAAQFGRILLVRAHRLVVRALLPNRTPTTRRFQNLGVSDFLRVVVRVRPEVCWIKKAVRKLG